ncbi:MAG: glycosyltransferase [Myxococcales bacterium]|nr:glycosyltransferase [Myxococcales bacterium]
MSDRHPAVTVLTPTLDAERFLSPMLSSLAAQTLARGRFEHIVIDGGSKDGTLERIRRESPETRVIVAPKCTIYEAMNIGLAEARGESIGWLNADDLWEPDALSLVEEQLDRSPSADVVIGDYVMFEGRTKSLYRTSDRVLDAIREGRMARWFDIWVNPLSVFYRTRFLRELGGYDPSYRLVGDWDLWFRAAARAPRARVVHCGKSLGSFRIHPGSLTSGSRLDRLFEEKRRAMARWIDDERAPKGLRDCARRMFRHDTLSLAVVRARMHPSLASLRGALSLANEVRCAGPRLASDVASGSVMALAEVVQSLPGVGTLARAAWAATGGPSVSSNT